MKKDRYLLGQRNKCICLHFHALVGRGMGKMEAYARTAESYYLSEKRVRDIVRGGEGGFRSDRVGPGRTGADRVGPGRTRTDPDRAGRTRISL